MPTPKLPARLGAEFLGTFWLVFGGCGSAIFAAHFLSTDATPVQMGIGFAGVALAFGLTVLTMAYAVGHVSGGHFNPAVTIGLATAKRFEWRDVPAYVATQVVAGLVAGTALFVRRRPSVSVLTEGLRRSLLRHSFPKTWAVGLASPRDPPPKRPAPQRCRHTKKTPHAAKRLRPINVTWVTFTSAPDSLASRVVKRAQRHHRGHAAACHVDLPGAGVEPVGSDCLRRLDHRQTHCTAECPAV